MAQTSLRFGLQQAAERPLVKDDLKATVGQHIEELIQGTANANVAGQLRAALKDPQSVIEIRSGETVQTATPDMPLRELLSPGTGEVEITVSKPHVGG